MTLSSPNDILRECSAALELFSEASPGVDFRAHVLALLALSRARLLPPTQQSLSVLGSNLENALRALERTHPLLMGISTDLSFESDPQGARMEPLVVRSVMSALHQLRLQDPELIARATEQFVLQHAQREESSFLGNLLNLLIPMSAGSSMLDVGCGPGLRAAQAQRGVEESQHVFAHATKLRIRAEESSKHLHRLASLVAVLCDLHFEFQEYGQAFEVHRSPRTFDRIFVEQHDRTPPFSALLRSMAEHSIAALLLPDSVVQNIRKADMAVLLERDVLDAVFSIYGNIRPTWHLMILRGRKSVERRHRVLFYDHIDSQDGPMLDTLSCENMLDAYTRFENQESRARVLHRSDILSTQRVLPGLRTHVPLLAYQRDTFPGALSASQFVELDSKMIQRGLDIHSFFQKSKRNEYYRPTFHDHSLIRVAVSSAPSLKNAEVRTHYAFEAWWSAYAPSVLSSRAPMNELRDSFVDSVCRDSVMSPSSARAVFRAWWSSVDDDRCMVVRHSAMQTVQSNIEQLLREAQLKGRRFWFELDDTQRSMLEYMCPNTLSSLQASRATIDDIVRTQQEVRFSTPQSITERLMQRRREAMIDDVQHAQLHVEVARERIQELYEFVRLQKERIQLLHQSAKAHRTLEATVGVSDDTLEMQDELGLIFARLVPAQSELSMLEKSLQPYLQLEQRREQEQRALEGFIDRLVPELRELRNAVSPQLAASLMLLQFREQLARGIEHALLLNREELVYDLEQVWKRLAQGSTFAPQVQGMGAL